MAPHHSNNPNPESSDDESAPETISLVQSKKEIKKLDAELKNAKVAVNQSKRRQNRQVDMKLKERAVINRSGRGKKGDELEDRMQRAMQEAEDEMDDEDENRSEGEAGLENTDDDEEDDAEDVSSIEDEQGSEEGEEGEAEISLPKPLKKKSFNANHLPDELFTAAFASKASTSKRKATDVEKEDNPQRQTRKKRKRSQTQKDMIIGSRAIRILPTVGQPILPSVAPSSKINKFLNKSLALKGGKQHSKTWERRPANIGVCRRDGPASNFVRNR